MGSSGTVHCSMIVDAVCILTAAINILRHRGVVSSRGICNDSALFTTIRAMMGGIFMCRSRFVYSDRYGSIARW